MPDAAAVQFDRQAGVLTILQGLKPDLVIDASGPFQAYGDEPYRLAEACIAQGISYLDLADGADFVAGINRLDGAARSNGVFVLSGCSTFPAVSGAILRELAGSWDEVTACLSFLAPSPKVAMGANVISAILSYAGERLRNGDTGLATGMRGGIRPAGAVPLGPLTGLAVDVPDLAVLSGPWPGLGHVRAFVATRPQVMLHLLRALAWARSKRLLPPPGRLAPLVSWSQAAFNWGEHRGGIMFEASGRKHGEAVSARFDLIADADEGPYIPVLAAVCVVKACVAGKAPAPGARSCERQVMFSELSPLLAARGMQ